MKKLLSVLLFIALVLGCLYFGSQLLSQNAPQFSFHINWNQIGTTIGSAAKDLVNGLVAGFQQAVGEISFLEPGAPATSPSAPTVPAESNIPVESITPNEPRFPNEPVTPEPIIPVPEETSGAAESSLS